MKWRKMGIELGREILDQFVKLVKGLLVVGSILFLLFGIIELVNLALGSIEK